MEKVFHRNYPSIFICILNSNFGLWNFSLGIFQTISFKYKFESRVNSLTEAPIVQKQRRHMLSKLGESCAHSLTEVD